MTQQDVGDVATTMMGPEQCPRRFSAEQRETTALPVALQRQQRSWRDTNQSSKNRTQDKVYDEFVRRHRLVSEKLILITLTAALLRIAYGRNINMAGEQCRE